MMPANTQPNEKTADRPLDNTRPFMDDNDHSVTAQTGHAREDGQGAERPIVG